MNTTLDRAPTLEDFCDAANDLYAAPTEERFHAVVNLARESLILRGQAWDEGFAFGTSQFEPMPVAWVTFGACTGEPVFSTTPPDDDNVAGWVPVYRRMVPNAELWGRLKAGPARTPGSAVTTTGGSMENVLDVRGGATLRQIREMAGRAMLDGPHDYATEELEGPLLDLAVAKAVGLGAVIHKVDNAIAPFFECCVLNGCGRLQYQYTPSRGWCQGGPLVEEHRISLTERGDKWAADVMGGWVIEAATPLLAAMRALVARKLGATVRM